MSDTITETVLTAANGRQVKVWIEETADGPKVQLEGVGDTFLDGDVPGEYYLIPDPFPSR